MQTTFLSNAAPPAPTPCFSASCRSWQGIHKSNSFTHLDGGFHSIHTCMLGCPVSSISPLHNNSSSHSSHAVPSAAGKSLEWTAHRSPFAPSSSSSSTSSLSPVTHDMGPSMKHSGRCNSSPISEAVEYVSEAVEYVAEKLGLADDEEEIELSEGSPQTTIRLPKQKEGCKASMAAIAQRWRELQGLNRWKGMLEPLDIELRRTILFYGDFNQAVYDGFEMDEHSKYTGACRFPRHEFFEMVSLVQGREIHYKVVRYLYATSSSADIHGLIIMKSKSTEAWSKESNWMGYVAVSDDESSKILGRRDILIVWRGTIRPFEWLEDFRFKQTDCTPLLPPSWQQDLDIAGDGMPSIEQGWLNVYTNTSPKSAFTKCSAREQVLHELKVQLAKYKDDDVSITIVGHSLGGALSILNAFDIAVNKLNVREGKETILVTAFAFANPSVGDEAFARLCDDLEGLRVLRIKNKKDMVPKFPGWLMRYRDVGEELLVNSGDSPYLKDTVNPGDWHNLEVYLHMVAGWQGVGMPFKFAVNRNVALINKSCEVLRDDFLVPGSWWQMRHRGLVQRGDGFWFMPDRCEGTRPEPEPLNDPQD